MSPEDPIVLRVTEPLRLLRAPRELIYRGKAFGAWIFPPWVGRRDLSDQFSAVWDYALGQTDATTTALARAMEVIMTTAENLAARINAATNEIADELKQLRADLADARNLSDAEKQEAVDAALAKLDGPISRLEGLGADPSDPVPSDPVPSEPTSPDAPADSGDAPSGGDAA